MTWSRKRHIFPTAVHEFPLCRPLGSMQIFKVAYCTESLSQPSTGRVRRVTLNGSSTVLEHKRRSKE